MHRLIVLLTIFTRELARPKLFKVICERGYNCVLDIISIQCFQAILRSLQAKWHRWMPFWGKTVKNWGRELTFFDWSVISLCLREMEHLHKRYRTGKNILCECIRNVYYTKLSLIFWLSSKPKIRRIGVQGSFYGGKLPSLAKVILGHCCQNCFSSHHLAVKSFEC